MADFKSERWPASNRNGVAGSKLECMAGFIGIPTLPKTVDFDWTKEALVKVQNAIAEAERD